MAVTYLLRDLFLEFRQRCPDTGRQADDGISERGEGNRFTASFAELLKQHVVDDHDPNHVVATDIADRIHRGHSVQERAVDDYDHLLSPSS
nr:hypothetical protein [Rhizobium leguminosarum]